MKNATFQLNSSRALVLYALIGALFAWVGSSPSVYSQGIPPVCSGGGEPGTNACGTVGVSCGTDPPCNGSDGVQTWWCCYEDPPNNCRQWVGKWKCCNGVWKGQCKRVNKDGDNLNCDTGGGGNTGHCFG